MASVGVDNHFSQGGLYYSHCTTQPVKLSTLHEVKALKLKTRLPAEYF